MKAFEVLVMMEKKGFAADLTVFDKIVNGLCKLNQIEEAKRLLNVMVKRDENAYKTKFSGLSTDWQSDEALDIPELAGSP
nr:pentatricopeptide repeat-containing protein, chloroplastic [Quercus suber]